jgi:tRNA threonylcarbamoyladenosine biosynthesis protein TsaE
MLLPPLICRLIVANLDAMSVFGASLTPILAEGDSIGLSGPLGAGKSTLARAIITTALTRAGIDAGDIPSPTFTLVQPYPYPSDKDRGREIWHFDLWRLKNPEEVVELGIEEALDRHISLIEWPERMGALIPRKTLIIKIEAGEGPNHRVIGIHGNAGWDTRIEAAEIESSE